MGLRVLGIPWKCSVTHKKRWRSSAFFYNRQLLLAREPRDNWFCLQALNHFFHPNFHHNCDSCMSQTSEVFQTREVLAHQPVTFGPAPHYALICTYSEWNLTLTSCCFYYSTVLLKLNWNSCLCKEIKTTFSKKIKCCFWTCLWK